MKRIFLVLLIFIITSSFFCGCEIAKENLIDMSSEEIELLYINDMLAETYDNFDIALEEEIEAYNKYNDKENLFEICYMLVLRRYDDSYSDYIIKYYRELLVVVKDDIEFRKMINENHRDFFDIYLNSLKNKGLKREYRDFFNNINYYVVEVDDIVITAIIFLPEPIEKVDNEDSKFFLQLFLDWEKKYCGNKLKQNDMFIYKYIYKFAKNLNEKDIEVEYKSRFEEIYKQLSNVE